VSTNESPLQAVIIAGDRRIAAILSQEGSIVYPAYACRYDGFVNDVFSEYASPSVVRPPSVRQARLVSELSATFSREAGDRAYAHPLEGQERLFHTEVPARLFDAAGTYYCGWTMYDAAGVEESLTVWLGARQLGRVASPHNDNRLRLYVLPEPYFVDEGERLRLVTDATDGAYRIESIVLLPALPQATDDRLAISDLSTEAEEADGRSRVRLNWRTSRPARCTVSCGTAAGESACVSEGQMLANHSVVLLPVGGEGDWFAVDAVGEDGSAATTGRLALADYAARPVGAGSSGAVPFTVTNRCGSPLQSWPVTWGFPFPRAALYDLAHVRVIDSAGQPLPSQQRVQVRWEDGSVRWALVDLQVDLPARGEARFTLEYGPQVSAVAVRDGLRAAATADGVQVDAGSVRLTFSRHDYAFPARVEVCAGGSWQLVIGGREGFAGITVVDATGRRYETHGEAEEVVLEEAGPLRATVRVTAAHSSEDGGRLFRSVLRVTAFRGQSFLRVQHTFENDHTADLYAQLRSLTLGAAVEPGYLASAGIDSPSADLAAGTLALRQPLADRFTLRHGERRLVDGVHAANHLVTAGPMGCLAVAIRDLWQNYPKGWEVDPDGLRIGICPDVRDVAYPQGGPEEVRSYFYLQGGVYRLKRGMARTHDMLFALGANTAEALAPVEPYAAPPTVRVNPRLFIDTGVLSPFAVRGEDPQGAYDAWVDWALAAYDADREATQAYGMLNYGDWYGERRSNWGDMEYDTPYGFLLEYVRGGSPRAWDLGLQAAWHLVDVDTCHYHSDPAKAGRQYLHSLGHVGGYYPDGYLPGAIAQESMSWTHTWVEGLFLYALLTGERRLWDVAGRTIEILAGADLNHYDFTNCRDSGWPLRHLIGAYQATGRRQFLNGARIIVERVLERQHATGGWERLMVPGHCFHLPPRHMGNAGFMVGILTAALKRYHEETRDAEVGQAIVAAARYLVNSMWEDSENAFHYTSCPQSRVTPALNAQILEGFAYAWRISGDERLRDVFLRGWEACAETEGRDEPPLGKNVSMRLRSMPFMLGDVLAARGG